MNHKEYIEGLIQINKIGEAIKALSAGAKFSQQKDIESSLLLLSARYHGNENEKKEGTLTQESYRIEKARITSSLKSYLEEYRAHPDYPVPDSTGNPPQTPNDNTTMSPSPKEEPNSPKKIFISYAHKDMKYKEKLETAFKVQKRKGKVVLWSDGQIIPGAEWKKEILNNLESADIIIMLLSSDFFASDFIWDEELPVITRRYDAKSAKVVPILIRPCDWLDTEYSRIQAVPMTSDGQLKAISLWSDKDVAWDVVIQGIKKLL